MTNLKRGKGDLIVVVSAKFLPVELILFTIKNSFIGIQFVSFVLVLLYRLLYQRYKSYSIQLFSIARNEADIICYP